MKSVGVTKDQVLEGRKGNFTDAEKLAEFYHCVFVKAGFQREDGTMVIEKLRTIIPNDVKDRDKIESVLDECVTHKGDTPQKTAFEVYKCYIKKSGYIIQ